MELEDSIKTLHKENEELRQKVKSLELEKEELRRKDAIEDMVLKAQTELVDRVKKVGALITAGLAIMGFATFTAFVNSISKTINEDATKTIAEEVTKRASKDVTSNVSKTLVEQYKKDVAFQNLVKDGLAATLSKDKAFNDNITKDPILQDKVKAIVLEGVRRKILEISEEAKAKQSGNFAQAAETLYSQESYFVVSGSHTAKSDLGRDVLGRALNKGFNAQICPPKKGNKRYALIVSDKPKLPLSYDNAVKVRDNARIKIQSDAYILPEKGAFFDCSQKSS
ncbi:MAG: hypothetical protein DCF22_06305 [Leptolyngbya sp.]|nr:MAG: hypothetical protein DCF22_06305 [Leptolyngbya sp.]